MSLRVTGSNKRLSVRLPAEGETLVRQGDELVGAPAGGGGSLTAEALQLTSTDGAVQITATGNNVEIVAATHAIILVADDGDNGGIVIDTTGSRSPNPLEIALDAEGFMTLRGGAGVFLQPQDAAGLIGEYTGAGAAQLPHQAAVTNEATVVAAWNLYRTYLITRGTMAAS